MYQAQFPARADEFSVASSSGPIRNRRRIATWDAAPSHGCQPSERPASETGAAGINRSLAMTVVRVIGGSYGQKRGPEKTHCQKANPAPPWFPASIGDDGRALQRGKKPKGGK